MRRSASCSPLSGPHRGRTVAVPAARGRRNGRRRGRPIG
ncbi:hypothetical protein SLI_4511 [Streptomyces lividans 1326]|uniref:Uncharacterized protein n=1 Tax=Streptomyces lividans 1326 TaxID=1200984 RepID=A0A7U9DVJ6_STRLI|nr:hypothetical protein SLI_4511 [Streptomyces lividans 1326]